MVDNRMKRCGRLLLLCSVLSLSSCALRWNGAEKVAVDPIMDLWIHHPEVAATNWHQTLPP